MTDGTPSGTVVPALDRARGKAYWRLLPLLFICYVIAYVDRANVAIAKLTMTRDLPGFDNEVIGFGAGLFFWGYFLLEIPGSLLVERFSRLVRTRMLAPCMPPATGATLPHGWSVPHSIGSSKAGPWDTKTRSFPMLHYPAQQVRPFQDVFSDTRKSAVGISI